jgi:hypothetical protein
MQLLMNADLIVEPIDDIRAAVETLTAGLGRGEVISPERWDCAVATLARCHDQVGGDTRRKLYDVFAASAGPEGEGSVADHLEVLSHRLQGRELSGWAAGGRTQISEGRRYPGEPRCQLRRGERPIPNWSPQPHQASISNAAW